MDNLNISTKIKYPSAPNIPAKYTLSAVELNTIVLKVNEIINASNLIISKYVNIIGETTFKYLGGNNIPENISITLTAQVIKESPTYQWKYWTGITWVNFDGETNTSIIVNYSDNCFINSIARISCWSGADFSEITLTKIYDGWSNYDIARKYGFEGTEEEWINSVDSLRIETLGYRNETEVFKNSASNYATIATNKALETVGYRNETEVFKNTTSTKASEASISATNSENSAAAALISEGLAEDYKDLALGYRNETEGFKNTAITKATEASNSAAAALISEQNSKTSEDNAKASELAARISETNSHNSEVAAGISETNAHNSEVAAGISETNSHNSELAAEGYATTATTQAGIATTKAGEAANSAISAANSAAAYHVYNITLAVPLTAGNYYTLASAIAATPSGVKKLGLVLTFADSATTWLSYQFIGSSTSGWTTASNWQRVITERTLIPDEYVIADAINVLYDKITALEDLIKNATFDTIWVDTLTTVKALNYNGASLILTGTTAPSVTPDFIGQVYIKTSSTVAAYVATGTTNSGDWKQTA